MKNVILNASFALFVSAWGISTAHAAPPMHARQMEVSYADLNLAHEDGARVMLSRLQAAARTVCGGWPDIHDLDALTTYRGCMHTAMDDALSQLHAPVVAALYGRSADKLALGY